MDNKSSPSFLGKCGSMCLFLTAASLSLPAQGDNEIAFARADDSRRAREGHGLYRTLANNMMVGVSTGFEKKLKLVGVGYKAAMEGSKAINLSLGYAHQVIVEIPEGLQVKCDSNTEITVGTSPPSFAPSASRSRTRARVCATLTRSSSSRRVRGSNGRDIALRCLFFGKR